MADVAHTSGSGRQGRQDARGRDSGKQGKAEGPPFWEWVVAAVGALLVAGSLAFLVWEALSGDSDHAVPAPEIRLLSVQPQGERFLARIRVDNRGQGTAEGLTVRGELKQGGRVVEDSEVELRYLPGGSSREAGLFFGRDPRQAQLELSASGYQKP